MYDYCAEVGGRIELEGRKLSVEDGCSIDACGLVHVSHRYATVNASGDLGDLLPGTRREQVVLVLTHNLCFRLR